MGNSYCAVYTKCRNKYGGRTSGAPDVVLWGINESEEDENEAADDISELPNSLNRISSRNVYEGYRNVLERIAHSTYSQDTVLKVEQTIAQGLLNYSGKNMEVWSCLVLYGSKGYSTVEDNAKW